MKATDHEYLTLRVTLPQETLESSKVAATHRMNRRIYTLPRGSLLVTSALGRNTLSVCCDGSHGRSQYSP